MLTVFLDANVLFFAAFKPDSRLLVLWSLPDTVLVTSTYAAEEARRNLPDPGQRATLDRLLADLRVIFAVNPAGVLFQGKIPLPEKDLPILWGAIQAKADVLLTGDVKHFGPFFGKRLKGIRILTPSMFLSTRRDK